MQALLCVLPAAVGRIVWTTISLSVDCCNFALFSHRCVFLNYFSITAVRYYTCRLQSYVESAWNYGCECCVNVSCITWAPILWGSGGHTCHGPPRKFIYRNISKIDSRNGFVSLENVLNRQIAGALPRIQLGILQRSHDP